MRGRVVRGVLWEIWERMGVMSNRNSKSFDGASPGGTVTTVKMRLIFLLLLVLAAAPAFGGSLPFDTVFRGRDRFDALVQRADEENWKALPIGERVCAVGRALVGTPYRSFTLEVDDRVEAPSVNLNGLDCWTFFETSLAFARMLNEPRDGWTPQTMLHFIELDRYRGGKCNGEYLSRLHYLEDWLSDNDRRGLVRDMTRSLRGVRVPHEASEMSNGWREYRYLRADPALLGPLRQMEERVAGMPLYEIPKRRVASIEPKLPGWRYHRHHHPRGARYFHRPRRACVPGRDGSAALHARLLAA